MLSNLNSNIINNNYPSTTAPNVENLYNLQYGGMIPQSNLLSNNLGQNLINGGVFSQGNNGILNTKANNYQEAITRNLMYQNYILQQNIERNNIIQQYLNFNGLQNNNLINQAAFGPGYNPQILQQSNINNINPNAFPSPINPNAFPSPFNQGFNMMNPINNMSNQQFFNGNNQLPMFRPQ